MANLEEKNGTKGPLGRALQGFRTPAVIGAQPTAIGAPATNGEATEEPKAGEEPGADPFDRALRAACRVMRDSMLLGYGADRTRERAFFKPNDTNRRRFYALMSAYMAEESLALAARFEVKEG